MIAQVVVNEIRCLLDEGTLSQRKIARQIGVSRGTVNAIAQGKRPDYAGLRRIPDDLLPPAGPPGVPGLRRHGVDAVPPLPRPRHTPSRLRSGGHGPPRQAAGRAMPACRVGMAHHDVRVWWAMPTLRHYFSSTLTSPTSMYCPPECWRQWTARTFFPGSNRGQGLRRDGHLVIIGQIAGGLRGQHAVEVNLHVVVVVDDEQPRWPVFPGGMSNVRRSQMFDVFHSVRTMAPGVSWVPNPPGPSFQAASGKSGWNQPSAGFSSV